MNWLQLKKKIWFYKEYTIIGLVSILLLLWVIFALGFVSKNSKTAKLPKNVEKTTNKQKIVEQKKNLSINLPSTNSLSKSILKDGSIDTKEFIRMYKESVKNLNDVKGTIKLKFSFFKQDDLINQVRIYVEYIGKDQQKWNAKQNIILKLNK